MIMRKEQVEREADEDNDPVDNDLAVARYCKRWKSAKCGIITFLENPPNNVS